ncbi:hypothetical protein LIER_15434 [Lithospermum erythrorhizon]|uniref:Uncharacterized protein n=1 Tax=Lithospermum erythrorhizon TaxID=34254 RepID=A0AAV3Q6Z2_LITER
MLESSQNPVSTFLEKVAAPETEKETSSHCLMIQDYSSDDDSLFPVMMVGASPQEDEIESEVDKSAPEETKFTRCTPGAQSNFCPMERASQQSLTNSWLNSMEGYDNGGSLLAHTDNYKLGKLLLLILLLPISTMSF